VTVDFVPHDEGQAGDFTFSGHNSLKMLKAECQMPKQNQRFAGWWWVGVHGKRAAASAAWAAGSASSSKMGA
jgi:hypothetical protein